MNKKIVYITSSFPFGKSEVWSINEINSSLELGNHVIIIPRTGKGEIINQDAIKFRQNLVDLPFLDWKILIFLLKIVLFKPLLFFKLLIKNLEQSNSITDFTKGLAILPKSLFLTRILKAKNIDHIHSLQTTSTAFMAFILSYILKVPWSYTLHTSEILNSRYRRSFRFRSSSASLCRTISQETADDLSNFLDPSLSNKVKMIPLGVQIKEIKKVKSLINDPFIIATPAELTLRKGHIYSLEAARELIDKGFTNFKWFFYGSGPLLNDLNRKLKELSLINHCFFLGNLDHHKLLEKYKNNKIDIVIISSVSKDIPEGIPVSLMEAMSYEIPVIATDCGGIKELVDGQTGILVNQNNPSEITNAIIHLIKNPDSRRKIALNGRNKVAQDFDTIKNTNELIKLF